MIRTATAAIDSQALQHNLQRVRQLAPRSRIIAVIKADAYGHGLLNAARALVWAAAAASGGYFFGRAIHTRYILWEVSQWLVYWCGLSIFTVAADSGLN